MPARAAQGGIQDEAQPAGVLGAERPVADQLAQTVLRHEVGVAAEPCDRDRHETRIVLAMNGRQQDEVFDVRDRRRLLAKIGGPELGPGINDFF